MANSNVATQGVAEDVAVEGVDQPKPPTNGTGLVASPPSNQGMAAYSDQDEYAQMMNSQEMRDIIESSRENVNTRAEIRTQRLALLQGLSPEIAQGTPGYKMGQIVNNITREILSKEEKPRWLIARGIPADEISTKVHCLGFIPVMKLPTEYIKWIKREDRKETDPFPWEFKTLADATQDSRVRAGVWPERGGTWGTTPDTRKKAPPVTSNINFLGLPVDMDTGMPKGGFLIATFQRKSEEAGKLLTKYVGDHGLEGLPPFGRVYYLYNKLDSNGKDTFQIYQVAHGPKLMEFNPSLIRVCFEMAKMLTGPEGKMRQEEMLNAADPEPVTDEETVEGGGVPVSSNPLGNQEKDPFGEEVDGTNF